MDDGLRLMPRVSCATAGREALDSSEASVKGDDAVLRGSDYESVKRIVQDTEAEVGEVARVARMEFINAPIL